MPDSHDHKTDKQPLKATAAKTNGFDVLNTVAKATTRGSDPWYVRYLFLFTFLTFVLCLTAIVSAHASLSGLRGLFAEVTAQEVLERPTAPADPRMLHRLPKATGYAPTPTMNHLQEEI